MRREAVETLQLDGIRRLPLDHETRACLKLWASMFEDAVRDYYRSRSTQRWVQSERADVGSFIWCCGLFNMDPGRVRQALIARPTSPDQSPQEDADLFPEDEC